MNRRRAPWACWRCQSTTGRNGRLVICMACKRAIEAAGQRWCNRGRHIVPAIEWKRESGICIGCLRVRQRAARRALDGIGTPPAGWVLARDLTGHVYADTDTIVRWLRNGWPVEWQKWSRFYYIKPMPVYPPPPDRRKR